MNTQDVESVNATPSPNNGPPGLFRRFSAVLTRWQSRLQQRAAMAGLSEAQLKDIGLSKADVWRETGKPFWDK